MTPEPDDGLLHGLQEGPAGDDDVSGASADDLSGGSAPEPSPSARASDRYADIADGLGGIFSPRHGIVADTGQRLAEETSTLLRSRLLAISLFFAVTIVAFLVRSLLVDDAGLPLVEQATALTIVLACSLVLSHAGTLRLGHLRVLETVLMMTMVVHLLWVNHHVATSFTAEGDAVGAMTALYRLAMAFFALMVAYGTFIPNTWRRTAVVSSLLAVAPLGLVASLWLFHGEVRQAFDAAATLDDLTFGAVFLMIGALLATLGSHVIHSIRTTAARRAEMGMYRLEEELGSGGMGQVWRAQHRMLARPAAIKMIRPELAGDDGDALDELVTRFEREARATAQLTSPHTVDLYDFGVTNDGLFYYVMEYLEGVNLERLVEEFGPQPPARVVYLLRQVAESLLEAHERGLIHRDIKPSNIYLTRKGGRHDFIKVLDFGLVKTHGERVHAELADTPGDLAEAPTDPGVSSDDKPRGTPAFMAPELALRDRDVDERSDIYALGCVAFWLLTGRFVFEGDDPVELVIDHVRTEPRPPSTLSELEIPEALDRIVLACLAKEPDDRPAGAAELLEMLDRCSLGGSWTGADAATWWELHMAPEEAAVPRPAT